MYKTEYLSINVYLQQEGITELELFEQLGLGEAGLLLNLENIAGCISGEKLTENLCKIFADVVDVVTYQAEITGLCLLTKPYFEILRNGEKYIYINAPFDIYEGRLSVFVMRTNGMVRERIDIEKKNWKMQTGKKETLKIDAQDYISFTPSLFNDKEEALNPKYEVLPYSKSASSKKSHMVYCYAIPKERLLVAKDDNATGKGFDRMFALGKNICLDKIVNHFWPKIKRPDKNKEVFRRAELAINSGDICCEYIDNKNCVDPEQFVLWMISENLFPEKELIKSPIFRYYKYYLEYEKLLDKRIYIPLPKHQKDYIFQIAEQNKINLFIKIKNRKETLKCFFGTPQNSTYSNQELQERRVTYRKIMEKKHYWKLNNFDCFGNYITKLYENDVLICDDKNFIFFEPTAIEKNLGISFQLQMHEITLDNVFVLEEELAQFNENKPKDYIQNSRQALIQQCNKNSDYINIANSELKSIVHRHNEIEVLQYAIKNNMNVLLNINLGDELCIRERGFFIEENGKNISYNFPFSIEPLSAKPKTLGGLANKVIQEIENLPIREMSQELDGKELKINYSIVETEGFEILPVETVKEFLKNRTTKASVFEIADRDNPERTYVQRYLGYKDDAEQHWLAEQVITVDNLYLKRDELLRLESEQEINNDKAKPKSKKNKIRPQNPHELHRLFIGIIKERKKDINTIVRPREAWRIMGTKIESKDKKYTDIIISKNNWDDDDPKILWCGKDSNTEKFYTKSAFQKDFNGLVAYANLA